jgi:hypothetical protein
MWRISFCGHSEHFTTSVAIEVRFLIQFPKKFTLKILSDMIGVASYFGQALIYSYFTIFSSEFLCFSPKT